MPSGSGYDVPGDSAGCEPATGGDVRGDHSCARRQEASTGRAVGSHSGGERQGVSTSNPRNLSMYRKCIHRW